MLWLRGRDSPPHTVHLQAPHQSMSAVLQCSPGLIGQGHPGLSRDHVHQPQHPRLWAPAVPGHRCDQQGQQVCCDGTCHHPIQELVISFHWCLKMEAREISVTDRNFEMPGIWHDIWGSDHQGAQSMGPQQWEHSACLPCILPLCQADAAPHGVQHHPMVKGCLCRTHHRTVPVCDPTRLLAGSDAEGTTWVSSPHQAALNFLQGLLILDYSLLPHAFAFCVLLFVTVWSFWSISLLQCVIVVQGLLYILCFVSIALLPSHSHCLPPHPEV